jgi:hypothetical protein
MRPDEILRNRWFRTCFGLGYPAPDDDARKIEEGDGGHAAGHK